MTAFYKINRDRRWNVFAWAGLFISAFFSVLYGFKLFDDPHYELLHALLMFIGLMLYFITRVNWLWCVLLIHVAFTGIRAYLDIHATPLSDSAGADVVLPRILGFLGIVAALVLDRQLRKRVGTEQL